ncbi:MAG: hypothetical protein ACFB15_09550 [Cyclobacteriaceae bacterium]
MIVESHIELPLYNFFDSLRKNGFSLGIAEYYLFLDSIHLGFGIDGEKRKLNKIKVLQLCKTLWLKPNQNRYLFESLFESNYKEILLQPIKSSEQNQSVEINHSGENTTHADQLNDTENTRSNDLERNNGSSLKTDSLDQEKGSTTSDFQTPKRDDLLYKFVLGDPQGAPFQLADSTTPNKTFFFSDYYFDISKRQMQQVCRFLPITQTSLDSDEIDIEESVQGFAQHGSVAIPVFKRRRRVVNEVLLLIDHGGSMLAFSKLAKTLVEALKDTFNIDKQKNEDRLLEYYFYNVPQEYCYLNMTHTEYEKTSKLLGRLKANYSSVIIISDAGAARGGNSNGRFIATIKFLIQLKKAVSNIVWLNPIPKERWKQTTANRVARFVPMFSLTTQHELQTAINVLKGK